MHEVSTIQQKFDALAPFMDERMRRLWAAAEAEALGWGGIATVAAATGLSRTTIAAGWRESKARRTAGEAPARRIRRRGGGRKSLAH